MPFATQELRLRQQTAIAPRLQQSVRMLQMSALELDTAVQLALATNPFLEDSDDSATTFSDTELEARHAPLASPGDSSGSEEPSQGNRAEDVRHDGTEPSTSEVSSEYSGDYPKQNNTGQSSKFDMSHWAAEIPSLHERLSRALGCYGVSDRDRLLAEHVIDALDTDGYLRQPLEALSQASAFEPDPEPEEWLAALKLVQQLDAPGLGARDLSECLLLQLQQSTIKEEAVLLAAKSIVSSHLDQLGRNDCAGLQSRLGCSADVMRRACTLIRSLDPKPGLQFDNQPPTYVVPDVVVRKVQSRWQVTPNWAALPRVRLHQAYADLFGHARHAGRSPMQEELQEARWLVRNVEQRHSTIQRVAEAIVSRQQRFFEFGDVAIRPLMLKEIADDLAMHESTVSRATANKYMATPRGVLEFRLFFSRELTTATGGSCSSAAVRALIREFIETEDPQEPLTDVVLTSKLASSGIVLARRTVSKYRGQLRLACAEMRKQF